MIIYDLEIKKAIPSSKEPKRNDIEYCGGWTDHAGMGISVLVAYDTNTRNYRVFTDSNKDEFLELVDRDPLVAGFNNINFDNKVVEACWGKQIQSDKCYDILVEIWAGAGLGPVFNMNTHTGYGLGDCCMANFGQDKTGAGWLAPVEWQRGNIGHVIDYCLSDVQLTKKLLEKIARDGYVRNPKNSKTILEVRRPGVVKPPLYTQQKLGGANA